MYIVSAYLITEITHMCLIIYVYAFSWFSCQLSCTTNSTVVHNAKPC